MTPAELERLALICEECSEVIQIANKIIRHGYDSYHPNDPYKVSNRQLLEKELLDVQSILFLLQGKKDVEQVSKVEIIQNLGKKQKYIHYKENHIVAN